MENKYTMWKIIKMMKICGIIIFILVYYNNIYGVSEIS